MADAVARIRPPVRELASDWTKIATGWRSLDVDVDLIPVATLAKRVCNQAKLFNDLEIADDKLEWLARFIDVVGECWKERAGVEHSALAGLMPNQNGRLCSPGNLKRDNGVSEVLKDICTDIGCDIRDKLLVDGLEKIGKRLNLRYLKSALQKAIPDDVNECDVIDEAVESLSKAMPDDKSCEDVALKSKQATARVLAHLWEISGANAASVAQRVPLVVLNDKARRWSHTRQFMAPVSVWPQSAQPFAHAYPPGRILNDFYAGSESENIPDVTSPLVEWGIAYTDPIIETTVDLKDRRLAELTSVEDDTTGIVVHGQKLSQIALLHPELLLRAQEGVDDAHLALLGLVLCHVARLDPAWKEQVTVNGRRQREDVQVSIRKALWIADLKVRAWVPVPGEDDQLQQMPAYKNTLEDLLDSAWLNDNDDAVRLLSECFGFDLLDLRLKGISGDVANRREVRDSLAGLVETGGDDPTFYKGPPAGNRSQKETEPGHKQMPSVGTGCSGGRSCRARAPQFGRNACGQRV